MYKIVYNDCYGGFGLSKKAIMWLEEKYPDFFDNKCCRHDPRLIECIETLGKDANASYANLKIEEINGKIYRIEEYDGKETILEPEDLDWIEIN